MNATSSTADERFFLPDRAYLKRWLPWLLMFRAFQVSIHYRQLTVALVAVWLLQLGQWIQMQVRDDPSAGTLYWSADLNSAVPPFLDFLADPAGTMLQRLNRPYIVIRPIWQEVQATSRLLGPHETVAAFAVDFAHWCWLTLIFLMAGGVITRIAALEITRYTECRLWAALRFVVRYSGNYVGGWLTALLGICGLGVLNAVFGWTAAIPYAGPYLLWLGWPLVTLASLMLSLMVLGLSCGWPLMISSASVEATDPFDGLSRSFNYLIARPWYALFLLLLMIGYGSLVHFFVDGLTSLTHWLALQSTGRWHPVDPALVRFWTRLLGSLPEAFLLSFFWTACVIIYLLLRKSEDGTPLDTVHQEGDGHPELPLIGIPAARHRERTLSSGTGTGTGTSAS